MFAGRLGILIALAGSVSLGAPRHIVNSTFHYQIDIPTRWNWEKSPSGILVIFNYDKANAGPQGLFPDDGANIEIIPLTAIAPVEAARTLDEWVNRSYGTDYRNVVRKRIPNVDGAKAARQITEVRADFRRDSQDEGLQRDASYFFALNGSLFRIRLLYWKDNLHARELEATIKQLLESIRAVP